MKSWKTPTPEQVDRALALLGRAEQYRYFFDRLENPRWLGPLAARNIFRRPPGLGRDESRGTINFPVWPASRYLARMARLPEAQEQVLQIVRDMPDTENVAVHEDLAEVALALPAPMAAQLVDRAKRWANSAYGPLLPEKLGALVEHLAQGGMVDEGLDLAGTLLVVQVDPRTGQGGPPPEEMRSPPEPAARFDVWHYEQILKRHLGGLVDAAGERALMLFADLLESAIQLSLRPSPGATADDTLLAWPPLQDYSYIWRPAIEEHGQNRRETVKSLLVGAVRNAAERLASRTPEVVPTLVGLLEGRRWLVFHRLALHLLRRFPGAAMALVEERVTNRACFDDPALRHEYVLLAAECFPRLSEGARRTVLGWIEQGPDVEAFRARYQEDRGAEPSVEEIDRYRRVWRRDRIAPLKDVLPPDWWARYEALVAELGEPEHPEFPAYVSSGWVGPTSPKQADELRAMTVEAIIELLRTWTPPENWFGPSREGLGRELASVVESDPERFAAEAPRFAGLDPTYVRALLGGLARAAEAGRAFDWGQLLELCGWVVRQPPELPERPRRDDEDPGWGWTRKAIAGLLAAGFHPDAGGPPFDLRDRAWDILRPLTEDSDPTREDEARYGGSNMDPATLSINTTRGEAMHAVVRYALWVRRHIEHLPDGQALVASGFGAMPEVREVIERHLDPDYDPTLAVRSVYGQWFPWLVLLDREWATAQVGRIFPTAPEQSALRDAAWETYIILCEPYDNVFDVLRDEYGRAVERIGTLVPDRRRLADPEERLAEHLMVFYWRGKLRLDEPGGLLQRFYELALDKLRGRAVEFVGRSLRETPGEVPQEIVERLTRLWEYRMARARAAPADSVEELANFGWWFASGKLDDAWAIEHLDEVMRLARKAEPDHLIAERLAALAPERPIEAVRCLDGLVEADREGWGILGWEDHARTILAAAMRSGDVEVRGTATALIDRLGRRGRLGFRDVLR